MGPGAEEASEGTTERREVDVKGRARRPRSCEKAMFGVTAMKIAVARRRMEGSRSCGGGLRIIVAAGCDEDEAKLCRWIFVLSRKR